MDKTNIYEKLNLFYLGKEVDAKTNKVTDDLLLVKNKNFTTHAAIIGMTGSGKTGLGIGIIEEAVLDKIPCILIDPKGDMGDLLLAFPDFKPQDFEPWIDENVANQKGLTKEEFAKEEAQNWEKGIESFGQDSDRVKRFKEGADFTIFTPGSSSGVSISILDSFKAPSEEVLSDSDTYSYLLNSTTSSILALIGEQNSINSKESILISNIFNYAWKKGVDLTLEDLIGFITSPPFEKIGVMELKDFYPQKERMKLAFSLNNIIASPTFSSWLKGVELDINKLLYTKDAKPRVSILNIAHLNDNERMFFVTLFLNKYISWMRMQSGSSSLRTLLYMDEIFGYFPATSNPPSKAPMLLLLKQARAFGVGIVLSTQNPVDLDYKGLSNIGSWFIGRLQTKQDIDRVINGLIKSGSDLSKSDIEELLANLQKRVFLFKSAHREEIELFTTRWVLSYLKGPLNKSEIKLLMKDKKEALASKPKEEVVKKNIKKISSKPTISNAIDEYFYQSDASAQTHEFKPYLLANAVINYHDSRRNIDQEYGYYNKYELDEDLRDIDWNNFIQNDDDFDLYEFDYPENSSFTNLPEFFKRLRSLKSLQKEFITYLYQENKLTLYKAIKLKLESKVDESLEDFKIRVSDALREKRDIAEEKLKNKFSKKQEVLDRRLKRALDKLEKEKEDVKEQTTSTLLSFGMTILDAFTGNKRTKRSTISKAGSTIRNAGKIYGEKGDVSRAEEAVQKVQEDLEELQRKLEDEILELDDKFDIDNIEIQEFFIKPKKSNITDIEMALLWEDR